VSQSGGLLFLLFIEDLRDLLSKKERRARLSSTGNYSSVFDPFEVHDDVSRFL
jgi:hypothetical protein